MVPAGQEEHSSSSCSPDKKEQQARIQGQTSKVPKFPFSLASLRTPWWKGNWCPLSCLHSGNRGQWGPGGLGMGWCRFDHPCDYEQFLRTKSSQGPCRKVSGHINFEHFIDPVPEGYRMGSKQPLSWKSSQASFWSMPGNMQVSLSAGLILGLCDGDDSQLPSWLARWHPRARAIKLDSLPNPFNIHQPGDLLNSVMSHHDHCYNHVHHLCQQDHP